MKSNERKRKEDKKKRIFFFFLRAHNFVSQVQAKIVVLNHIVCDDCR